MEIFLDSLFCLSIPCIEYISILKLYDTATKENTFQHICTVMCVYLPCFDFCIHQISYLLNCFSLIFWKWLFYFNIGPMITPKVCIYSSTSNFFTLVPCAISVFCSFCVICSLFFSIYYHEKTCVFSSCILPPVAS